MLTFCFLTILPARKSPAPLRRPLNPAFLVLGVVNAPSAHLALRRVADFCEVSPERIADLCRGIVVQRLVRRLNPETRQARETQALELKEWGLPVSFALPRLDTAVTVYSRCPPTESDKWGDTRRCVERPLRIVCVCFRRSGTGRQRRRPRRFGTRSPCKGSERQHHNGRRKPRRALKIHLAPF